MKLKTRNWRLETGKGYTLIELMVAIGLFAIVMLLSSGAYLLMINATRQAQGVAIGINNLSFALETMARTIRTGTRYSCGSDIATGVGANCTAGTSFYVTDAGNTRRSYGFANGAITQDGTPITDSSSVTVSSLSFYASGTANTDNVQPRVTITVYGNVIHGGADKQDLPFTVETSATMRGTDI